MNEILSRSAEETGSPGRSFAATLRPGDVVALKGRSGAARPGSSPESAPVSASRVTLPAPRSR